MNEAQSKAWEHLTDLEKSTLSLVLVSGKTKQEASIVLNIYPYKFTEIYNRATKLFTTLTDYYGLHSELLPSCLSDLGDNLLFIRSVLVNRRKPAELVQVVPAFMELAKPSAVSLLWEQVLLRIQMEPGDHPKNFYSLLKTFDQWNNFRILPTEYREPSPFPRRRNREFKKIHLQLNSISELGWATVDKRFGHTLPPIAFIPMVSEQFSAMSVRLTRHSLVYFTKNRIPVFSRESIANDFAEASYDFYNLSRTSTYSAQKFWAGFRLNLQKAINYNELLNIKPGDLREFTNRDRQFIRRAAKDIVISKKLPSKQSDPSQYY